MDENLWKSSFLWFKFQSVWSSLQRVMTVLMDMDQLKQLLFSISFFNTNFLNNIIVLVYK
jgi:hypothetical protein